MDSMALYILLVVIVVALFNHIVAIQAQSTPSISSHIKVVGAVYCDTCLNNGLSRYSYFIPGADVHIQCKFNADSPKTAEMISISVNRSTDNNGVYKLEIPSVDGVDCIDGPPILSFCQATLLGSASLACNVPTLKTTTTERSVKSKQENLCVYGFAPLSFRPRKKNDTLCRQLDGKSSDSAGFSKFLKPPSYHSPSLPTSTTLRTSSSLPLTRLGSSP